MNIIGMLVLAIYGVALAKVVDQQPSMPLQPAMPSSGDVPDVDIPGKRVIVPSDVIADAISVATQSDEGSYQDHDPKTRGMLTTVSSLSQPEATSGPDDGNGDTVSGEERLS